MKILIVTTIPFGMNGITNVILNNYYAMDRTGKEFHFLLPNEPSDEIKKKIDDTKGKIHIIKDRMKNPLAYMIKLNKLLQKNEYTIMHVHGNSHTLAIELVLARINNISVRIPHAHNTTTRFGVVHRLLTKLFKESYTHGMACGIEAGKWMYGENKFYVLDNGINVEKYKYNINIRKEMRLNFGFEDKHRIIGHVGHFTKQKNQEYLIDLFSVLYEENNNYRLLLIGDGVLKKVLENKVNKLGLTNVVEFLGNRNDVPKLFSAIDVLIMPSLYEGLPLSLVEAQAADLKCFVSDHITTEVNITGNTEFFKLEDDYFELVSRIEGFFNNESERQKKSGYKLVEMSKFNIKNCAIKLEGMYHSFSQI